MVSLSWALEWTAFLNHTTRSSDTLYEGPHHMSRVNRKLEDVTGDKLEGIAQQGLLDCALHVNDQPKLRCCSDSSLLPLSPD